MSASTQGWWSCSIRTRIWLAERPSRKSSVSMRTGPGSGECRRWALAAMTCAFLVKKLGANHYIDSTTRNVTDALQSLGGAKVVLATVTAPAAITATIDGLRARGEMVVIGVSPERIEVSPVQLIPGQKTLRGHASGTSREVEETIRFAALSGVRSISEEVSLEQAPDAFEKMLRGAARFRMVLTTTIH